MKHRTLFSARGKAFATGMTTTMLLLGCDYGSFDLLTPGPGSSPPVSPPGSQGDPCDLNPLLASCWSDPSPPPQSNDVELARANAENILRANCGQCHGSHLEPADAEASMNYIDDIDELIFQGKAIPGDAENSPIVRRMRNGSMPPVASSGPRPSDFEINTVAQFLDNPLYFPDASPIEGCSGQLLEFDDIYELLQNDILRQDDDDREFTRYLLLTNRYNQGICTEELDADRFGMNKMLNMLSVETSVETAFAIDRDETIYRIDIRDFGWDRDIEVDGQNFENGWEAIVAQNAYATEFQGDEAEQVIFQAETNVPWMYSDSMIDVASQGNLYYALIDVDVNDSLDDFILNDLGIDVIANVEQEELVRAATTQSLVSRYDRVVERHDIEVRQGAFWQAFEFNDDDTNESIFDDPLGIGNGTREALFTLPNGFLAYLIADENDNIVEESNLLFDTLGNDFATRASVSCSGCHALGPVAVVDEVRDVVEGNRFNFTADEFEAVQDVYPRPEEFSDIVYFDSEDYQRSLSRAGIPTNIADPMSNVFLTFDQDLSFNTVAGDLGVTVELLEANIALLDPQVQVVREGLATLDRNDFTDLYLVSLCVMQASSHNQPLSADCDDATAQLE